jgi:serine/threonine protein phosphatase PrpC
VAHLEAAVVSEQGPRPSMEDRHVLRVDGDRALGAVFDGHNGAAVAEYAAEHFPGQDREPVDEALRRVHAGSRGLRGGACAVAFRLAGPHLEVANVGDAELAVVTGAGVSVLTEEHRLTSAAERARVQAAGAILDGPYAVDPRTGDGLMPTRGVGDHAFADIGIVCEPYRWSGPFAEGWLVAACDGLWDVLAPEELPDYLTGSAAEAARALAREALAVRGSFDNLTVIVLRRTQGSTLRGDASSP